MTVEWLRENWGLVALVAVWELVWKGMALWKAAQSGSKAWFVVLLILNTAGILPIAYLFFLGKENRKAHHEG